MRPGAGSQTPGSRDKTAHWRSKSEAGAHGENYSGGYTTSTSNNACPCVRDGSSHNKHLPNWLKQKMPIVKKEAPGEDAKVQEQVSLVANTSAETAKTVGTAVHDHPGPAASTNATPPAPTELTDVEMKEEPQEQTQVVDGDDEEEVEEMEPLETEAGTLVFPLVHMPRFINSANLTVLKAPCTECTKKEEDCSGLGCAKLHCCLQCRAMRLRCSLVTPMRIQGSSQEVVASGYTLASQQDMKHAKVYKGGSNCGKTLTPAKRQRGTDLEERQMENTVTVEIPPKRRRPRTTTESDNPDFEPRWSSRLAQPPIPVKAKKDLRKPRQKYLRDVKETTILQGHRFLLPGSSHAKTPLGTLEHCTRNIVQLSEMRIIETCEEREAILSMA